ncbi:MAG: cyclic nucleotide-binding domain-containing protein [Pseudomonadales bacterium]
MSPQDVFIGLFFVANILFCLAYVVQDIVYLRTITIVAAICTYPYFFFQESPLYSAMFWQSAFIVINSVNLIFLWLSTRPVNLDEWEEKLHIMIFSSIKQRDMLDLIGVGTWQDIEAGEIMVRQGEFITSLSILVQGSAEVIVDGEAKATLDEGDFIGEMSFITGNSASADVRARTDVKP